MTFLQPSILWALLAVAIPVIIHLLNRRRHRTVRWAAMQFLLKATRESRGRKRLRRILILTCRALGVAALVFAAALPVVGGFLGFGAGQPDLVVVVLDRSASMEAKPEGGAVPRREIALQRMTDAFADLDGTRVVLIDSASGRPQDVPSPDVLPELSATAATDTAADLPDLLTTAAEFLAETPGRAEVWIASDLQSTNWRPDDDRWTNVRATLGGLTQPPNVRVLALGGESASNQSVRVASSRRAGGELLLDLEIRRSGDARAPVNLPLTTHIDGADNTESLTLAGQEMRLRKSLPLREEDEDGFGWVSLPGDGNLRDNVAFFAYGPERPIRSRVVAPAGEAADYLALAAAPDGFGGQSSEAVQPAAFDPDQALDDTATLFWAAPLPQGQTAEAVRRFLENGGQAVFFPPPADAEREFLGMEWSAVTEAERDRFFILDSWNRDDGLLRDGIDGTSVPADRLRAIKRRIPTGDEATVLARWDDTEPFLSRRVTGDGTAWFVGSLPDYTWSNLADADVLLPLAQRAVLAGADRFDSGYLAELGGETAAGPEGGARQRLDTYASASDAADRHLAGVYRLSDRLLALNRPAEEDLRGAVATPTLRTLFENLRFSLFENAGTTAEDDISRGIWRAFLAAMLFFLIAEALLCLPNKPTETFSTATKSTPPQKDRATPVAPR